MFIWNREFSVRAVITSLSSDPGLRLASPHRMATSRGMWTLYLVTVGWLFGVVTCGVIPPWTMDRVGLCGSSKCNYTKEYCDNNWGKCMPCSELCNAGRLRDASAVQECMALCPVYYALNFLVDRATESVTKAHLGSQDTTPPGLIHQCETGRGMFILFATSLGTNLLMCVIILILIISWCQRRTVSKDGASSMPENPTRDFANSQTGPARISGGSSPAEISLGSSIDTSERQTSVEICGPAPQPLPNGGAPTFPSRQTQPLDRSPIYNPNHIMHSPSTPAFTIPNGYSSNTRMCTSKAHPSLHQQETSADGSQEPLLDRTGVKDIVRSQ